MDVKEAINKRRAYRSLEPVEITPDIINSLAGSAQLSPSCFNNQPWRYVFVTDPEKLIEMHSALSQGNDWAKAGSMIIAVFSKKENDCLIKDREYYLFDTGMATAFIILRATEIGLVAHPIAGFSPKKTREILRIPDEMNVITLVIVGKHSSNMNPLMNEDQIEVEKKRPERLQVNKFVFMNKYESE
jgi:nitroreductase